MAATKAVACGRGADDVVVVSGAAVVVVGTVVVTGARLEEVVVSAESSPPQAVATRASAITTIETRTDRISAPSYRRQLLLPRLQRTACG